MNANEHGFVLAKFQPPKGERIVECENGEFILHCDHAQITKKLEENNLELAQQNSALQLSQDDIINALGITGDGPVSQLVIEYVLGLVAENVALKSFGNKLDEMHNDLNGSGTGVQGGAEVACQQVALEAVMEEFDAIKTPATDAAITELRAQGVIFTANRMLAAWKHGFINASEAEVADITGAVLGMLEFLPNAEASELTREYADEVRARIAANLRAGRKG